jgi:hypothetical protein
MPAKHPLSMSSNETPEPLGGRQAKWPRPSPPRLALVGETAGGEGARSNDPDKSAPLAQGEQPRGCRLEQLIVIERAIGAGNAIERIEGGAEGRGKGRQISFLGDGVRANEHAVRADADRSCAMFGRRDDAARQEIADAVNFRTRARACRRQRPIPGAGNKARGLSPIPPLGRLRTVDSRDFDATQRHGWPPTQRTALASRFLLEQNGAAEMQPQVTCPSPLAMAIRVAEKVDRRSPSRQKRWRRGPSRCRSMRAVEQKGAIRAPTTRRPRPTPPADYTRGEKLGPGQCVGPLSASAMPSTSSTVLN